MISKQRVLFSAQLHCNPLVSPCSSFFPFSLPHPMANVEVDLDELRALALASPIYPALIDYVFSGNTPYCKACKTAVPAFRIESHITHNHKQYRNTMRWPVWNYFRALPVAQHWHDLKPLPDNFPVETCIRSPVKGFTCRSCGHKSSHPVGISNHCNKEHNLFVPSRRLPLGDGLPVKFVWVARAWG